MKERKHKIMFRCVIGVILVVFILVVLLFMILPPSNGKAVPFTNSFGQIHEGSISEKSMVEINGTRLGTFIQGKDATKPVLLICGGGPGIPEYLLDQLYPNQLTDEFVVCYFDYRGTGLSYQPSFDRNNATTQQYIDDVVAMTNYLRDRFKQDKIYILGHSFGTYIGLKTVQSHPELYQAYIAMSQICDQTASEKLAFTYMKEQYENAGNKKMIKKFNQYDINNTNDYDKYCTSSLRDKAMHDLGVGTARNMKSVISGLFFPSLKCSVYTQKERINIWKGKIQSNHFPVTKDALHYNAFEDVPSIKIPIYFLAGANDYTCCYSLQKKFYEAIQAPMKGFYTFDYSAHSPIYEEPDRGLFILKNDVLNHTTAVADNMNQ